MLIGNLLGVPFRRVRGAEKVIEYLLRQEFATPVNPHPNHLAGEVGGTHMLSVNSGASVSDGLLKMTTGGEIHASNGTTSTGMAGVQLWPRSTVGLAYMVRVSNIFAADSALKIALHDPNSSNVLLGLDYRTYPGPALRENNQVLASVGFLTAPVDHEFIFVGMGMNNAIMLARNAGEPQWRVVRAFHIGALAQTVTQLASMATSSSAGQDPHIHYLRVLELAKADSRFGTFEGIRLSTAANPVPGTTALLQDAPHASGNVEVELPAFTTSSSARTLEVGLRYQDADNHFRVRIHIDAGASGARLDLVQRTAGTDAVRFTWLGAVAVDTPWRLTFYVDGDNIGFFRLNLSTNVPVYQGTFVSDGVLNMAREVRVLSDTGFAPNRLSVWPRYLSLEGIL